MPELAARQVTVDFKKALWSALRAVLPTVKIQGCVFHWTQAVWRKVQELGLQTAYSGDDAVYQYIRKIMALAFLPYLEILPMFVRLEAQAQTEAEESRRVCQAAVDRKPSVYSEKLVRLQTADPN
ncbi:uncharacterized protein [Montipora capricornis]|uniref:uncharacterized protein n=1 Tax=Montipora capricornis TaxID=246305 RepID=UPI0035F10CC4